MSTLLQVNDITKIYQTQPKPGLDHVSFDVMQGEFLGIMGASGSGKTTLLNVLSTIDVPTSGNINMGKVKIQELNQRQAADFRKDNLGFIFQEYFLLDSLTVQENIAVPLTLLHKSAKEIDKKVMELAELVHGSDFIAPYLVALLIVGGQKYNHRVRVFRFDKAAQIITVSIRQIYIQQHQIERFCFQSFGCCPCI